MDLIGLVISGGKVLYVDAATLAGLLIGGPEGAAAGYGLAWGTAELSPLGGAENACGLLGWGFIGWAEVVEDRTGFDTVATLIAGAIVALGLAAHLIGIPGLTIPARMKRTSAAVAVVGFGLALLFGILGGWELLACAVPAIAFVLLCLTGSTYLNLRLRQRVARGHRKRLQTIESPWLRRFIERAIVRDRAYFGEEQEREKEEKDSQAQNGDD